jgi:hypothetical protein
MISWLAFQSVSFKVSVIFGAYVLYSASFFGNVFFSFYLCQTENKNWRLKVMIFTMMMYAASYVGIVWLYELGYFTIYLILYAIIVSIGIYLHWLFCYIYLKQQIEVKYLLDNRIYAANQEIIM